MANALVIIDLQKGFVNKQSEYIVPRIKGLIQKGKFDYVLFTKFVNRKGSPYRKIMNWHKFGSQSETDIVDELLPFVEHLFVKNVYSAFTPRFSTFLKKHSVRDLFIVGIDTECCVLKTAVDAFELGYSPHVLAFYSASHEGKAYKNAGLKVLVRLLGKSQVIHRR